MLKKLSDKAAFGSVRHPMLWYLLTHHCIHLRRVSPSHDFLYTGEGM